MAPPLDSGKGRLCTAVLCLFLAATQGAEAADQKIFDEMRFGLVGSVADGDNAEDGVAAEFTVFFDPLGRDEASGLRESLMRPRVHLGAELGIAGSASQAFAGLSWTVDLTDRIFAEAGFGGLIHDGTLDDNASGPGLGCRGLFREYAALGYNLDRNWRVMAQVEHASHANLCDDPNDGFTRAGMLVGYRF
ncbi:acyloxyacyl hydrolase [Agrobacterium sp. a22-2]|uniref:acyloxyacyl hydrolase n=1 Tax=Agrobacterium sp. a22-2 TaxID=2283840 RepID=UPI0014469BD4|nr:acyloxyacyl hydrolase [Agrobacterium sp. a22-2]NKN36529.1 acyloxyacyl hydrolase [Agrobacterium sp. a22-2]